MNSNLTEKLLETAKAFPLPILSSIGIEIDPKIKGELQTHYVFLPPGVPLQMALGWAIEKFARSLEMLLNHDGSGRLFKAQFKGAELERQKEMSISEQIEQLLSKPAGTSIVVPPSTKEAIKYLDVGSPLCPMDPETGKPREKTPDTDLFITGMRSNAEMIWVSEPVLKVYPTAAQGDHWGMPTLLPEEGQLFRGFGDTLEFLPPLSADVSKGILPLGMFWKIKTRKGLELKIHSKFTYLTMDLTLAKCSDEAQ